MKHTHPKILAERARLHLKLEMCEQRIQEDIEALKHAFRPVEVAKNVIHQAADSFRDNSVATQGMRLALTLFPRRFRHPIVGIAAQIGVPLLLRNLPSVVNFVARKTADFKETTLGEKLGNIWARIRGRA
ncbi:MAG: hypothetical protein H7246_16690 [Phycisphaerae bacterium]|nr:hypothetical protein [Saprospiraceae bacterium]